MGKREILKFKTNVPVVLILKTEPADATGYKDEKYGGTNWLYIVEVEGTEKVMYATDKLQTTIKGAKLFKDMTIELTKAEAGEGKICWEIDIIDIGSKKSAPAKEQYATKDEDPPADTGPGDEIKARNGSSVFLEGWQKKEISIHVQVAYKLAAQMGSSNLDDLNKNAYLIYRSMSKTIQKVISLTESGQALPDLK